VCILQVVMPIATAFAPELVIISAGFDAAEGDPLGGCSLTPAGYSAMTHQLLSLAHGRYANGVLATLKLPRAHFVNFMLQIFVCHFLSDPSTHQLVYFITNFVSHPFH